MFANFKRLLQKKPETSIGLDIGDKNIDLVQVERSDSKIRLVNFMRSALPAGAVEDGVIMDKAVVSKTIKNMLSKAGISTCSVATCVRGKSTNISLIKQPFNHVDEIKRFLEDKVNSYLTFVGTETLGGFFVTEEIMEEEQKKLRVLHGVSKKEVINSYIETIKQAGCEIDFIGLGVIEALRGLYPYYSQNTAVVTVIEHADSYVFLINRGVITFLYTTGFGMGQIEADEDYISRLGAEIDKVITYAKEFEGIDSVEKIVLTEHEDGINEARVKRVLEERAGMKTEIAEPLAGLEISVNLDRKELSDIKSGPGLAMRAAGINPFPGEINLMPAEEIEGKVLKCQIRQFFIGLIVILLVIFLGLFSVQLAIKYVKNQAGSAGEILSKPAPVITELIGIEKGFRDGKRELQQATEIIKDVRRKKWSEFLAEIKTIIPRAARLTMITSGQKGELELRGEAASQGAVFDFEKNLRESPYFKDIELKSVKDVTRHNGVFAECSITGKLYFYRETR